MRRIILQTVALLINDTQYKINLISSPEKKIEDRRKKKILGLITLGRKYHVASREWGWKEEDCRCEAQFVHYDYSLSR